MFTFGKSFQESGHASRDEWNEAAREAWRIIKLNPNHDRLVAESLARSQNRPQESR